LLVAACVLVPIIILVGLIHQYAVNVPVTDQYEMIPLFQKIDHGTLSFFDLWAQHNEHRVLFPTSYLLGLAKLTHWNIKAEIISSFFVSLFGFSAILLMIKKSRYSYLTTASIAVAASFLFFSPIQQENWLWGWQIEWFMCIAAVLWSIYFLSQVTRDSNKNLIAAIGFGVFASYCLASGPLIWPAGLLALAILKVRRKQYVTWSVTGAVAIFLYYLHYKSPVASPPKGDFISQPINFVKYFLAYLGSPVTSDSYGAVLVGALILLTAVICLIVLLKNRHLITKYVAWLTLGFYVLMSALATTVGRMGFGLAGALSSRYTTFSLLFLISTIVVAVGLLSEKKLIFRDSVRELSIIGVTMSAVGILIISSYYSGLQGMKSRSHLYRYIKSCSQAAVPDQACLYQIYFPSTQIALNRLDYLKQKHYGGY